MIFWRKIQQVVQQEIDFDQKEKRKFISCKLWTEKMFSPSMLVFLRPKQTKIQLWEVWFQVTSNTFSINVLFNSYNQKFSVRINYGEKIFSFLKLNSYLTAHFFATKIERFNRDQTFQLWVF